MSYVEKDNNDDFFYLKYLDCVEDFDEEQKEFDYFKLINKQKELIEEGLLSVDLNVRNKYLWLKNDFNKNIKSHGDSYDKYIIK